MKASELRIGNKIKNIKGTEFNVLPEDFLEINANPDNYQGIPLTEEWLLKFGCTKETDTAPGIGDFSWYEKEELGHDINFFSHGVGIIGITHKYMKYVHEFQNLYFALTGKELEIK